MSRFPSTLSRALLMADEPAGGAPPKAPEGDAPVSYMVAGKKMDQGQFDAYLNGLEAARLKAENEKMASENEKATLRKRVSSVFNEQDPDRIDAARTLFKDIGYKDEEIEEWIRTQKGETVSDKKESKDKELITDQETAIKVKALEDTSKKMLTEMLKGWSNQSQKKVIDSHKGLGTLIEAAERIRGKDKAEEIRQKIATRLQEVGVNLAAKQMQATNSSPTADLFDEAYSKAADSLVDSYSGVIGDASLLGRSAETTARANPFQGRKKAPEPTFKSGMDRADLDTQVESFLRDELLEMAAEAPEGRAGSML